MAKTPAQRGPIGTWLVNQRLQRGWNTAEKARGELERLGGLRYAESVYAEWESGSRLPSEANLARLEAFYGSSPKQTATPPDGDVAAAIREQTQVYRTMIEQFRRQSEAQERRLDLLERLVVNLLAPAARAEGNPAALRVMEEWGLAALASMPSQRPEPARPAGEG